MRRAHRFTAAIITAFLLLGPPGTARSVSVGRTVSKPVIDGHVEELWSEGFTFDSFVQMEPDIQAPASERTEFYFMYDADHIYLAARLFQDRRTIHSTRGKRDADIVSKGDYVSFIIDPMNNGNMAYVFMINPSNGVMDGNLLPDGTIPIEWDGIFRSETCINDEFWMVELEIPLSAISFQNREVQDWGVLFFRYNAERQEKCVNYLPDINNPFRIDVFQKIKGLRGLKGKSPVMVTPYLYSSNERDLLSDVSDFESKAGFDAKFSPASSITILGTVNPDYAQLETDEEIINMSDLPDEYPEKRPFFIESSEFYDGAAVNTRNIMDIKTGMKIKKVDGSLNYDLTGVLDGDDTQWYLGNARLSNSNSYLAEMIGGLRKDRERHDYNITTHASKWLFDKRLIVYNWVGTINSRLSGRNEWETCNSLKWNTRTVFAGFWSHLKTEYYNPNILGLNYLSNETVFHAWFNYSFIRDSGVLRKSTLELHANEYDLYTDHGHPSYVHYATLDNYLYVNPSLGMWNFIVTYSPASGQKFRYRDVTGFDSSRVYNDAISPFVLIDHPFDHWSFEFITDRTRAFGGRISYCDEDVRGSDADCIVSEAWLRLGGNLLVTYDYAWIDVAGSPYQPELVQTIHRFKAEYNMTERLNVRLIVQPIHEQKPGEGHESTDTVVNAMLSWEYGPGNHVYLVFNKSRSVERSISYPERTLGDDQIIAIKISRSFSL